MSAPLAGEAQAVGCHVEWREGRAPDLRGAWWYAFRGGVQVAIHSVPTMEAARIGALAWLEDECRAASVSALAQAKRVKAQRVALDAPGQTVVRGTANEEDLAP